MKLTYKIYNYEQQMYIRQDETAFVTFDGKVGFIDTVGRFIEVPEWCIKDIKIEE